MALRVIGLCEKMLQLPPKNITFKIVCFIFFVINPFVHDIYMTNLLDCITRHLHPTLVSMEWYSTSHSNIH